MKNTIEDIEKRLTKIQYDEFMAVYESLPDTIDDKDSIYDRKQDMAFFTLFLDHYLNETYLNKWCEITGTELVWNLSGENLEFDGRGRLYHPQLTYFYRFLPNYVIIQNKKYFNRRIDIFKGLFESFIDHLRRLEMREIKLDTDEYNRIIDTFYFPEIGPISDKELQIFSLYQKYGSLTLRELSEKTNYNNQELSEINRQLMIRGFQFRGRFDSNLFKINQIVIEVDKPILFFTKWHHSYWSTSKTSYIYLKIPSNYREDKIFGLNYKTYESLTGGMGFTFKGKNKSWDINSKKLCSELNKIEFVEDKSEVPYTYTKPIEELSYEHFLVGHFLEIAPTASQRQLIQLTGVYRKKIVLILEDLKDRFKHRIKPFLRNVYLPNILKITLRYENKGIYNLLKKIGDLFPTYVIYRTFDLLESEFNLYLYIPENSLNIIQYQLKKYFKKLDIEADFEIGYYKNYIITPDISEYFDEDKKDWIFDPKSQFIIKTR